jgi:polar amino acid transport system substrate-binding protein
MEEKMKKSILAVLLIFVMAFGLVACTGSKDKDSETKESTNSGERTKLVVGFDAEYPPYGYKDENGEYTGFDLELAQAVCDLRGWELVKTPIDWSSKDLELNSGSIDCIWNGFTINGREDDYTWSVPYVDNSQVIVTSKDSKINTLADLSGKNVGVQAASAALNVLNDAQKDLKAKFASLTEYPDYNTAFTELQAGAIDAIAMDVGVADYQLANRGSDFIKLDEVLNSEQYGIGFKLGNTELKDQVEESLMQLVDDGTYEKLAEKYGLTDYIILGK